MLAGRWLVSLRVGATLLLTNEETMLTTYSMKRYEQGRREKRCPHTLQADLELPIKLLYV